MGISGMGRKNLKKIPVDDQMRLIPDLLEQQILSDIKNGYKPCALVATLGTTGTLAVDPIGEIAPLCKRYGIWLHVDAAYAGTALLLPEYRWMIEGAEQMDSFVFNPHKWMFTNFDCSVYFVKNADLLIRTFEVLPEYLKTKTRGSVNDYRDWGVPLGRRFRALKLWFVMRSFGLQGITDKILSHISLSNYFTAELQKIPGLELAMDPFLNFSCFRYRPDRDADMEKSNALNEKLLEEINSSGRVFLTHTKIRGWYTLRMLIGQTYVEKKHVDLVLKEIQNALLSIN
jgi:aromatic-L-amino-acid decarboxylase